MNSMIFRAVVENIRLPIRFLLLLTLTPYPTINATQVTLKVVNEGLFPEIPPRKLKSTILLQVNKNSNVFLMLKVMEMSLKYFFFSIKTINGRKGTTIQI